MSILDDLFAIDEEVDRQIAAEAKAAKERAVIVEEPEEEWLVNSGHDSSKKASVVPPLRDTKLKTVHSSKLVWAKCHYFKGGRAYFPGRIADLSEAACEEKIPTTIDPKHEVIEFFCLPKLNPFVPQFLQVLKSEMCPYNSAPKGGRQLSLLSSFSNGSKGNDKDDDKQMWDTGYEDIMRERLKEKYSVTIANCVFSRVVEKAREFLSHATDYRQSSSAAALSEGEEEEAEEGQGEEGQGEDLFSLVASKAAVNETISAGRWICFQHKIFKDNTVYVRVVEVTGNPREPLLLENDDVLRPSDVVCLLDEIPLGRDSSSPQGHKRNVSVEGKGGYVKGSGASQQLHKYKFRKGKINFESLHDELQREVRDSGRVLEEGASSAARSRRDRETGREKNRVREEERESRNREAGRGTGSSRASKGGSAVKAGRVESVREIMTIGDSSDEDEVLVVTPPSRKRKEAGGSSDRKRRG